MVFTCTTRRGATLTTVTGTTRLSSPHTCVMPTFSPTIAFVAISGLSGLSHANAPQGREPGGAAFGCCRVVPGHRRRRTQTSVTSGRERLPAFPPPVQGGPTILHDGQTCWILIPISIYMLCDNSTLGSV